MTRKKWNRLRRQRPELFDLGGTPGKAWAWERLDAHDLKLLKTVSKAEVIAGLTAWIFTKEL